MPSPIFGQIAQFASSATASSQYGTGGWSSAQVTGEPNTFGCGDIQSSWAPSVSGPDPEWLEVRYTTPVYASELNVYETYNTGFVYRVDLIDTDGLLHTIWTGQDTTPCPGVFAIGFEVTLYQVVGVKIYTQISGWEEIDAVKLEGTTIAPPESPTPTPTSAPPTPTPTPTPAPATPTPTPTPATPTPTPTPTPAPPTPTPTPTPAPPTPTPPAGPVKLAFTVQPTTTLTGGTISPALTVEIQDSGGARVAGATNSVTIALETNPSGGNLSGTTTVNAVNGVATFSDVSIDAYITPSATHTAASPSHKHTHAHTLKVTSSSLTSATSDDFSTYANMILTVQPSETTEGGIISPPMQFEFRDAQGDPVLTNEEVFLFISINPSGGTLSGTTTKNTVNGVATFSDLSIDQAGNGYKLLLGASGHRGVGSTVFNITPP